MKRLFIIEVPDECIHIESVELSYIKRNEDESSYQELVSSYENPVEWKEITPPTDEEIAEVAEFNTPIEIEEGFVFGAKWMRERMGL